MSRSNPTDGARNPSTRWFSWNGGGDQGFVNWYDKDAKQDVKVEGAFTFLLLDELSTMKGWHDPSESGIYANEVRDLRQEALVVKSFKGGELASGLYAGIKDKVIAQGGHYHGSIYLAYKDGDSLKIGNLGLKGAALSAWMDFKKNAPIRKDAAGKAVRAFYVDAIRITGYEDAKKGGTAYRIPKFALATTSAETNQQAVALDAELQAFFAEYFKRPKAEAAKPQADPPLDEPPFSPEEHAPAYDEADIPY
jgi:hypothetical protein